MATTSLIIVREGLVCLFHGLLLHGLDRDGLGHRFHFCSGLGELECRIGGTVGVLSGVVVCNETHIIRRLQWGLGKGSSLRKSTIAPHRPLSLSWVFWQHSHQLMALLSLLPHSPPLSCFVYCTGWERVSPSRWKGWRDHGSASFGLPQAPPQEEDIEPTPSCIKSTAHKPYGCREDKKKGGNILPHMSNIN